MNANSTIDTLETLHRDTKRFTAQNVIEALAVLSGIKPVLRMLLDGHTHPHIHNMLSSLGLCCIRSRSVERVMYITEMGDSYSGKAEDTGNADDLFVVMAARSRDLAERAVECEGSAELGSELGVLLGYPSCCVKAYENISQNCDWVESLFKQSPPAASYPSPSNKLSYLFMERSLIYDYFPCSLNCPDTARLSANVHQMLSDEGMGAVANQMLNQMTTPIFLKNGVIVSLEGAVMFGDSLQFNLAKARMQVWKCVTNAEDDYFWESDRIRVRDNYIEMFRSSQYLGTLYQQPANNRLLIFNNKVYNEKM